jgi:hypothetical protein
METGWSLQLLRIVLLFSFACTSLGADGPSVPAALLPLARLIALSVGAD